MSRIGIIKGIDRLGRLVIPKKYRELFGLTDKAEIILIPEGILIVKPQAEKENAENE